MPCSKAMKKCYAGCLHRRFVEDYRLTRHAQLLTEEAVTLGGEEEIREYRADPRNRLTRPVTFKEWLLGNRAGTDETRHVLVVEPDDLGITDETEARAWGA